MTSAQHCLADDRCEARLQADPGMLRLDSFMGIQSVLLGLGLDPHQTIAQAGLDPRMFADPTNEIPIASLGRLFAHAVARSGCAHVGLLAGQSAGLPSLGMIGRLARHCPTVNAALCHLSEHLLLQNRGAVAPFLTSGGVGSLGFEIYEPGVEGATQICDSAMAISMNVMSTLCGADWHPTEVLFAHSRPADMGPYQRFFDTRLHFDADRTAIVFPEAWLGRRCPGADPRLFSLLSKQLAALETRPRRDLVSQLRPLLRMILLSGRGSVADVADRLRMHRRTLNRRLRARGTTLHRLLEEASFEVARQLVENTEMPMIQIAVVLGYADASGFTRAFQRWAGRPPSTWRAERRGRADAKCQAPTGLATYHADGRERAALRRISMGRSL